MEGSCRDDIETRSHSVNDTCYCICVDPIVPQAITHLFINTRLPISDNCFMNRWRHLMKYALLTLVFIIATRRHDFLHNIPVISCSLNIQCKRIWQAIYSGTRCYKTMFGSKSTKIKIIINSYYFLLWFGKSAILLWHELFHPWHIDKMLLHIFAIE